MFDSSIKAKILVYFQFCFAHDTARVIQCLIQFGSEDQRNIVFDELKGIADYGISQSMWCTEFVHQGRKQDYPLVFSFGKFCIL